MQRNEQAAARRAHQKAILLVDDSHVVRGLFADLLRNAGHYVEEAWDGHHAQGLVERSGPFDLLMTDYRMPGMSGVDLALWFRERWPDTALLLVSASPDHLAHAGGKLPFATCLLKTSHPDKMLATVAKLLATTGAPDGA